MTKTILICNKTWTFSI